MYTIKEVHAKAFKATTYKKSVATNDRSAVGIVSSFCCGIKGINSGTAELSISGKLKLMLSELISCSSSDHSIISTSDAVLSLSPMSFLSIGLRDKLILEYSLPSQSL